MNTPKFCAACGTALPPDTSFCPGCGKRTVAGAVPTQQPQYHQPQSTMSLADILAFVVLGLCAAIAVLFFFNWMSAGREGIGLIYLIRTAWEQADISSNWLGHSTVMLFLANGGGAILLYLLVPILCAVAGIKLLSARGNNAKLDRAFTFSLGAALFSTYTAIMALMAMSIAVSFAWNANVTPILYLVTIIALACAVTIAAAVFKDARSGRGIALGAGWVYLILGIGNASTAIPMLIIFRPDMSFQLAAGLASYVWYIILGGVFTANASSLHEAGKLKTFAIINFVISGSLVLWSLGSLVTSDGIVTNPLFGTVTTGVAIWSILSHIAMSALCFVSAILNEKTRRRINESKRTGV
jgi:hypothetical protein